MSCCKYVKFKFLLWFISQIGLDPPLPTLKLGTPLFKDGIKEGDDVYFDCLVVANPPVTKVVWMFNVCIYLYYFFLIFIVLHLSRKSVKLGSDVIWSEMLKDVKVEKKVRWIRKYFFALLMKTYVNIDAGLVVGFLPFKQVPQSKRK